LYGNKEKICKLFEIRTYNLKINEHDVLNPECLFKKYDAGRKEMERC